MIVDVATLVEYHKFSQRLRDLGFRENAADPMCRWILDNDVGRIKLDVMLTDEQILGFSNRWYKAATNEAFAISLPSGIVIRIVSPA